MVGQAPGPLEFLISVTDSSSPPINPLDRNRATCRRLQPQLPTIDGYSDLAAGKTAPSTLIFNHLAGHVTADEIRLRVRGSPATHQIVDQRVHHGLHWLPLTSATQKVCSARTTICFEQGERPNKPTDTSRSIASKLRLTCDKLISCK